MCETGSMFDHCRGVLLAFTHGKAGQAFNFGGNAERTNLEIVTATLQYCEKPTSLISFVADRPGHDKRYAMGNSFSAKKLGFSPLYSFEEGVVLTLDWYSTHTEWVEGVLSGAYTRFMDDCIRSA